MRKSRKRKENKRTLKEPGLLLVRFWEVRKLGDLGKSGNPGISLGEPTPSNSSRGKELGGPPRKLGGA